MSALLLPTDYHRIKLVQSFDELITTRFGNGVNALCWERTLPDGFSEVVQALSAGAGITTLDESRLLALPLSATGQAAVAFMLEDLRLLRAHGLDPVLDCINGYVEEESAGPVPTHVRSFHVDSADAEADTYLCTYHGRSSEGLRNEEGVRWVDVAETRAELLKLYGGSDDEEFLEFLNENFFDLHYAAAPNAQPFSFGKGNLWRIAVQYPGSPVPACIHRAPETVPSEPPRLLLIS